MHRSTVYRIEKLDQKYGPRIETISALVESRGLTVTAFVAALEGVSYPGGVLEIEEPERRFLELPADVRRWAIAQAVMTQEALRRLSPGESLPEAPLVRSTRPGSEQRR